MLCTLTCVLVRCRKVQLSTAYICLQITPANRAPSRSQQQQCKGHTCTRKVAPRHKPCSCQLGNGWRFFYSLPEPCLHQDRKFIETGFFGQELLAAEAFRQAGSTEYHSSRTGTNMPAKNACAHGQGSCTMPSAVRNVITCMLGGSNVNKCTVGQCHPADRPACARCTCSVTSVLSSGPKRSDLLDTATCALTSSQDT